MPCGADRRLIRPSKSARPRRKFPEGCSLPKPKSQARRQASKPRSGAAVAVAAPTTHTRLGVQSPGHKHAIVPVSMPTYPAIARRILYPTQIHGRIVSRPVTLFTAYARRKAHVCFSPDRQFGHLVTLDVLEVVLCELPCQAAAHARGSHSRRARSMRGGSTPARAGALAKARTNSSLVASARVDSMLGRAKCILCRAP